LGGGRVIDVTLVQEVSGAKEGGVHDSFCGVDQRSSGKQVGCNEDVRTRFASPREGSLEELPRERVAV